MVSFPPTAMLGDGGDDNFPTCTDFLGTIGITTGSP